MLFFADYLLYYFKGSEQRSKKEMDLIYVKDKTFDTHH